jgi:hypothetical protein
VLSTVLAADDVQQAQGPASPDDSGTPVKQSATVSSLVLSSAGAAAAVSSLVLSSAGAAAAVSSLVLSSARAAAVSWAALSRAVVSWAVVLSWAAALSWAGPARAASGP